MLSKFFIKGPPISVRRGGRLITVTEVVDPYGNHIVSFNHGVVTSDGRKVKQKVNPA